MKKIKFSMLLVSLLLTTQIQATIYEDAEDEKIDRWHIYDNTPNGASLDNIYIQKRDNHAIQFIGTGTSNGYMLGNLEGKTGAWNNAKEHILKWRMRFKNPYIVYVSVMTKNGARYLQYTSDNTSLGKKKNYIKIGLGSKSKNDTWQTFTRDLVVDLKKHEPHNQLLSVNAFLIRGNGSVDDVELLSSQKQNTIESMRASSNEEILTLSMNGQFSQGSHSSFFIDTDNDAGTGYSNGVVKGVEYLVQDNFLYRYSDNSKGWKWDKISDNIVTQKNPTTITSKIPLNLMDIGNYVNYVSGITTSDWKKNMKYEKMEGYRLSDKVEVSKTIGARTVDSTPISKGTLFASVKGNGENCQIDNPCSITTAFSKIKAGDVLFLREGTYKLKESLILRKRIGSAQKPIIIESYPNELAILDGGESIEHIKNNEKIVKEGIKIAGSSEYIYIRKLEIKNVGGAGVFIEFSSHNIVEGCRIHNNHNGGINIYGGSDGQSKPYKPYMYGYNILKDNIIYKNSDVGIGTMNHKLLRGIYGFANGNNSDGISISSGKFNKVIHNTIYSNSDDGIDTWRSNNSYIAYNKVYDNGKNEGDGNGIKTGGNLDKNIDNGARAVVEYNIAYNNKVNGFDYNFGKQVKMRYNTSYHNGNNGFRAGGDAIISYNISFDNKYNSNLKGIQKYNSWDIDENVDFVSTDPKSNNFLKPKVDSTFEKMGAYANTSENNNHQQAKIFVIGDSTTYNKDFSDNHGGYLEMGWAQKEALGSYMLNKSNLFDEGRSGASSKSYKTVIDNRHDWQETKKLIKDTDISDGAYLLIQFGHNDEKGDGYTKPNEFYSQLEEYIDWAKLNNVTPILITPVERRAKSKGNLNHKTHEEAGGYAQIVRDLAEDKGITMLDLQDKSWNEYNTYEDMNAINNVLAYDDNTHFSPKGAKLVAGWVKELICKSNEEKLCLQFK